jgi:zinc protease
MKMIRRTSLCYLLLILSASVVWSQTPRETPPPPAEPRPLSVPAVSQTVLPNGLTVVVVPKKDLPLVTAYLVVKGGADRESAEYAGLADVTASMLTKGTALRSATQIAEDMEFLGADLNTNANWNASTVTVNVMRDKLGKALAIMADSVIRPRFPADELNLLKKQTIDSLKVSLKQPGAVLTYVSGNFTYGEHSPRGTPESIARIRSRDVDTFHYANYRPDNAVLVFAGDLTDKEAFGFAKLFFGGWQSPKGAANWAPDNTAGSKDGDVDSEVINRFLVVDLPDSGQAAVGYAKRLGDGRVDCGSGGKCGDSSVYFPASVLNSILGGGYSARLNQEIRIKRGLSYGARSGFDWRWANANFNANTQTKNESAAEVAELIQTEVEKLAKGAIANDELVPRKAVVTGSFGRALETNAGLASRVAELYLYGLDPNELNSFIGNVSSVTDSQIKEFASKNLLGGDMIIVGDAKLFMDDLTKRFPNRTIEVIKASDLDLNRPNLRKR